MWSIVLCILTHRSQRIVVSADVQAQSESSRYNGCDLDRPLGTVGGVAGARWWVWLVGVALGTLGRRTTLSANVKGYVNFVKGALKRKSNCPAYFFEFLTRFFKAQNLIGQSNVIANAWPKLLFSCDWQLFLQPQVIDGAWDSETETLLALMASVMIARSCVRVGVSGPHGRELIYAAIIL